MLDLRLREEFRGKRLKGTAIELSNDASTGATQIAARDFLEITYPTHDILKGIEAVGPNQGRPVVVIGERGLGKSHLMAALYHTVHDPTSTKAWLDSWASTLNASHIGSIPLRDGMLVIGESLHRQRFKFLWDLLFERHPHGSFIKGKWEGMGSAKTDIPSDNLIVELLRHTPTMLLLDEYQTWFDGLTNTKQFPWKNWAFNFIQILSEIAKEHPDLLVLVVSVRNGDTDAYQQIHRVNPLQIDFKAGGSPDRIQQDRRRMLLHRLFENRLQITPHRIEPIIHNHISEYNRLLNIPSSEQDRKRQDFLETWPFAPHLLQLLEDQVLVATDAQETRDLIRILANLFKAQGKNNPILTAADFRLDDDAAGIGALLDSVANQQHRELRAKAMRNLTSVTEAVADHKFRTPHLSEVLGALWLRSIAIGNMSGAEPATLQVDISRDQAIDDNFFQVELAIIIENSFNIHQLGNRLIFREEENPQARLMSCARNDRLFTDGSDLVQLAKEVRYVIAGPHDTAQAFHVIVLPKDWQYDPWSCQEPEAQPDKWDERLPILILPEAPEDLQPTLGQWLKDRLNQRRNTVRFLLPRAGSSNLFLDRDLLILSRAILKAREWSVQNTEYKKLHTKYQEDLRDLIKKRFDRFALLRQWNFADARQCSFHVESLRAQGPKIPAAIEAAVVNDLFVPEDFESFGIEVAKNNKSVADFLKELKEPRPEGLECIPWLGETTMKERLLRMCARGKLAIDLRGLEYLQAKAGEDEDAAWLRIRGKLSATGRQLQEVKLLIPSAVPNTGTTTIPTPPPTGGDGENTGQHPGPFAPGDPTGLGDPPGNPGGIFGGSGTTGSSPRKRLENPATSPLNLIGKLENWGIGPATPVNDVTITITAAKGAQLLEMLKKLPEGMTFALSLEKEEN